MRRTSQKLIKIITLRGSSALTGLSYGMGRKIAIGRIMIVAIRRDGHLVDNDIPRRRDRGAGGHELAVKKARRPSLPSSMEGLHSRRNECRQGRGVLGGHYRPVRAITAGVLDASSDERAGFPRGR